MFLQPTSFRSVPRSTQAHHCVRSGRQDFRWCRCCPRHHPVSTTLMRANGESFAFHSSILRPQFFPVFPLMNPGGAPVKTMTKEWQEASNERSRSSRSRTPSLVSPARTTRARVTFSPLSQSLRHTHAPAKNPFNHSRTYTSPTLSPMRVLLSGGGKTIDSILQSIPQHRPKSISTNDTAARQHGRIASSDRQFGISTWASSQLGGRLGIIVQHFHPRQLGKLARAGAQSVELTPVCQRCTRQLDGSWRAQWQVSGSIFGARLDQDCRGVKRTGNYGWW